MIKITKLNESQFKLNKYDLILGNSETYNEYFSILIEHFETKINIGLQTITGGINPKVEVHENNILLINGGQYFYGLKLDGTLIKVVSSEMIFYDFHSIGNNILIIGEIELLMLNSNLTEIWSKQLEDITLSVEIIGAEIVIHNSEGQVIKIDLITGQDKF